MEGSLKVYISLLKGWKEKYFTLQDGVLSYSESRDKPKEGSIHMKIASIKTDPKEPLCLTINSGTSEIQIKAANHYDLNRWLGALKQAQEDAMRLYDYQHTEEKQEIEKQLPQSTKKLLVDSRVEALKDQVAELWSSQAQFEELLSDIVPKIEKVPGLYELAEKLERLGSELKKNVTISLNDVEDEKRKLTKTLRVLQEKGEGLQNNEVNMLIRRQEENIGSLRSSVVNGRSMVSKGENDGRLQDVPNFKSFDKPVSSFDIEEEKQLANGNHRNGDKKNSLNVFGKDDCRDNSDGDIGNMRSVTKISVKQIESLGFHPIVAKLLETNSAFKGMVFPTEKERDTLPHLIDPNQKLPIWNLLRDFIGKDLTKFAVPVWLNEPLSMLQRLCEALEYAYLLDEASKHDNSCLRLAYICAFAITPYVNTLGRSKKPFNPLLAETFEYVPPDRSYRFISEQVSHHPPISAGYAEGKAFKFWGDSNIKTTFWGKSLEVKPLGSVHVVINKFNDHVVFNKAQTTVHNLIFGVQYADNHGTMNFKNYTTKDTAVLNLKKRGWSDKGAFEIDGEIKDSNGKVRYTVVARWDSYFKIIDAETKQERMIWERNPLPPNAAQMYGFNKFALQLNYLNKELIHQIAPTDSRWRPDQRAYENGMVDLAAKEKLRLEEKQRARRRLYQTTGKVHKARWFREVNDPLTGEISYEYTGGYWEARENNSYTDVLDIYTDDPV